MRSRLFCGSWLAVGCSLVVAAAPPPPFVSRCFSRCCFVLRFLFLSFFLVACPSCFRLSLVSGPGCPGPWRCVLFVLLASRSSAFRALSPLLWFPPGREVLPGCCPPPPPLLCHAVFLAAAVCSVFFYLFFCFLVARPRCLWLSLVSGPGCPGPWRCVLFVLLTSRSSALRALSPLLWFLAGCWVLSGGCCRPPPPFVSRCFSRCCFVLRFLFLSFFLVACPSCFRLSLVSGPGCPGPWRCVLFVLLASRSSAFRALSPLLWFPPGREVLPGGCPPPPLCVSLSFSLLLCAPFFFLVARPRCLWLSLVSDPGCPGPWHCVLFVLLGSCFSALRELLPLLCFPPGRWLLPGGCPPPLCVSRFSSLLLATLFFFPLLVGGSRRLPPPPPWCVRGALCCLVLPRCAALPCCVLCCGASPCCVLGCCALCGVCWGVCLCVVLRCWLLLRVLP